MLIKRYGKGFSFITSIERGVCCLIPRSNAYHRCSIILISVCIEITLEIITGKGRRSSRRHRVVKCCRYVIRSTRTTLFVKGYGISVFRPNSIKVNICVACCCKVENFLGIWINRTCSVAIRWPTGKSISRASKSARRKICRDVISQGLNGHRSCCGGCILIEGYGVSVRSPLCIKNKISVRTRLNFGDCLGESGISIPTAKSISYFWRIKKCYCVTFNREFINSIGVIGTAIEIIVNRISYNIPLRINGNIIMRSCFNFSNCVCKCSISIPATKCITRSWRIEECYISTFNGKCSYIAIVVCSTIKEIGNRVINSNPLCKQGDRCIISRKKILYTFVVIEGCSSAVCFGIPIYKSITYFAEFICL